MRISGVLILAFLGAVPAPAVASQDAPRCVAEPRQSPAPGDWFVLSWSGQPDVKLHVETERVCEDVAAAITAARSGSTSHRDRRARAQGERVLATLPASGDLYLDRFGRAHHFIRSEDATQMETEVTLSRDGPRGEIYARVRYPAAYAGVRGLYATPTSSVAFLEDPLAPDGVRGLTYGPATP